MKRLSVPLLGLVTLVSGACNTNSKPAADPAKGKADSLYSELLKEHDKGMSGWMKIEGRQQQIRVLLDSIGKLPSKTQPAIKEFKDKLQEANSDLGTAYEKMDEWMKEMNLDSAANNAELRIQYLAGEKLKGASITQMINNSLQKADSLLKAKR